MNQLTHIQDGMKHIFPKDFIKIYKDKSTIIIDIREPYELVDLPFENATNIPLNNLLTFMPSWSTELLGYRSAL